MKKVFVKLYWMWMEENCVAPIGCQSTKVVNTSDDNWQLTTKVKHSHSYVINIIQLSRFCNIVCVDTTTTDV